MLYEIMKQMQMLFYRLCYHALQYAFSIIKSFIHNLVIYP